MQKTLLQVRLIHAAFILTWFQFILVLFIARPPEQPVPALYPLALGAVALLVVSVCLKLRKQLLDEPAASLRSQSEDQALLKRWRTGNIVSFAFAESITLYGVLLKFLGEGWKTVSLFFAAGLVLLLLWRPRAIRAA